MTVNLESLYTVNYFPVVANNYVTMWESYSSSIVLADFRLIKSLGFNTVRVFLGPQTAGDPGITTGSFNWPTPTSPQLANLTDLCNQANNAGVQLHVTLFDHFGNPNAGTIQHGYGQIAGSQTWATAVVGAMNLSAVVCIELQNETFWSNTATYVGTYDSGWPGTPPGSQTAGAAAVVWATAMIPFLRTTSGKPICTSTTDYHANAGDLVAEVAALSGTAVPDWFEWHSYPDSAANGPTPINAYSAILADLTAAVSAVSGTGKSLYIGETGTSSFATAPLTSSQAQQAQVAFLLAERQACIALGLPEPAPWVLYDGYPDDVSYAGFFGLYDINSNLKPSGQMYELLAPGGNLQPPLYTGGLVYA